MVFKELGRTNYFGGRCLLAINNIKNVKKQIKREGGLTSNAAVNAALREKQQRNRLGRSQSLLSRDMVFNIKEMMNRETPHA